MAAHGFIVIPVESHHRATALPIYHISTSPYPPVAPVETTSSLGAVECRELLDKGVFDDCVRQDKSHQLPG